MTRIIFLLFFWSLGYYGTIYFDEIKLVFVALMPYICYLDPLYSSVSGVLLLCSFVVSRFKKRRKKVVSDPNIEKCGKKVKHGILDGRVFYQILESEREIIESESERLYGENGIINNMHKKIDDYKKETERMNENENKNESGDPLIFENGNKSGFGYSESKLFNVENSWVTTAELKIDELLAIAKKEPVPVTLSNVPTWIDVNKYSPTDDGEYLTTDNKNNIYACIPFKNGKWESGYNLIGWLPRPVTGCVSDKIQVVNAVQETPVLNWQPISEFDKDSVGEKAFLMIYTKGGNMHSCIFRNKNFFSAVIGDYIDFDFVTHFLKLPQLPKKEITTIDLATLSQEKQDAIRKIMNT